MKVQHFFYTAVLIFLSAVSNAQIQLPEGFTKATVTMLNGTTVSGFIKDNIKKSSTVTFLDETGKNKTDYDANAINALKTESASFITVNGDFFKMLSSGKLNFLQKSSNSSGKAIYNGTEAIFSNGTEGKVGDYFIYANNTLKLLTKKNLASIITSELTGCTAAIDKAKTINGDIAKLQEVVEIYNNYTIK